MARVVTDLGALADTSVFIAIESRGLAAASLRGATGVSVITIGELRAGVLGATDTRTRSVRMQTLAFAQEFRALAVDEDVAAAWADLRIALREARRRMPLNDSWIAATALAHGLALVTQDADYDVVPGLDVVKL